jgi:ketosteroid isomerase-like protein
MSTWSDYDLEVTGVEEGADGRVLVCMHQRMRGGATGIAVESDLFQVWTLRDGVPVRAEMYFVREAAYDAARIAP